MADMLNVLSALFESKSTYLMRQVSVRNASLRFPAGNQLDIGEFTASCGDESVLISGGEDDERAALICSLIREAAEAAPVIIISCGNPWLSEKALQEWGLAAERLRSFTGRGMSGIRQMAVLTELDPEGTLAVFLQFAFEVCHALERPATVESAAMIDWQEFDWQLQLLQKAPPEISGDLLARFDKDMAKCAAKASVLLERLMRGAVHDEGCLDFDDVLRTCGICTAYVPNSTSPATRILFGTLEDAMERGSRFLLVLDNVYPENQALIRDDTRNMRLILSCHDLCAAAGDLVNLTQRRCNVALFCHEAGGSAEKLSAHFFGMYERRYAESSISNHRGSLSVFSNGISTATSIRTGRDYRLDPSWICRLPRGTAFVRSLSCGEGLMVSSMGRNKVTRKRIRE